MNPAHHCLLKVNKNVILSQELLMLVFLSLFFPEGVDTRGKYSCGEPAEGATWRHQWHCIISNMGRFARGHHQQTLTDYQRTTVARWRETLAESDRSHGPLVRWQTINKCHPCPSDSKNGAADRIREASHDMGCQNPVFVNRLLGTDSASWCQQNNRLMGKRILVWTED